MPIKGISEVRQLPRIGKIRLGITATSDRTGGEYPKAVDYFVVHEDGGITTQAMSDAFHEVYGDEPRELDILFPADDMDIFFQQWRCRYGRGTGLKCKGDGETALEVDTETGELVELECLGEECQWTQDKSCRPLGRLMFMLPKVRGFGCWEVATSSFNSIRSVNSALDFIKGITGGRIAMIPLKLIVVPKEVAPGGKKKTVWVLDIQMRHLSLEKVLAFGGLPAHDLLAPPDTTGEMPDDLFPRSMQKREPEATVVETAAGTTFPKSAAAKAAYAKSRREKATKAPKVEVEAPTPEPKPETSKKELEPDALLSIAQQKNLMVQLQVYATDLDPVAWADIHGWLQSGEPTYGRYIEARERILKAIREETEMTGEEMFDPASGLPKDYRDGPPMRTDKEIEI